MLFVRRIPTGVFFALGIVALLACEDPDDKEDEEDDNQFREDVIQCEEAIARLERCCPGFDPSHVLCNYYFRFDSSTCGPRRTDSVQPALNLAESRCVLDTSCEELVDEEVCKRAQDARPYTAHTVTNSSSSGTSRDVNQRNSHPPVCP